MLRQVPVAHDDVCSKRRSNDWPVVEWPPLCCLDPVLAAIYLFPAKEHEQFILGQVQARLTFRLGPKFLPLDAGLLHRGLANTRSVSSATSATVRTWPWCDSLDRCDEILSGLRSAGKGIVMMLPASAWIWRTVTLLGETCNFPGIPEMCYPSQWQRFRAGSRNRGRAAQYSANPPPANYA